MLNPAFPIEFENSNYILDDEISKKVTSKNNNFDTIEDRFEEVYTFEIKNQLSKFNINLDDLKDLSVLDICAGSGFLSYHLLKISKPREITLLDISEKEINHARKILNQNYPNFKVEYLIADFLNHQNEERYDLIIGNSFLHHFCNLPLALKKIKSMLKPGGLFIDLHEPTIPSCAFESRNPSVLLNYILKGDRYIESLRKKYSKPPYDGFAEDVWIFNPKELEKIFNDAGFSVVKFKKQHLFSSIIQAYFSFFPNYKNSKNKFLKLAINLDSVLSKILSEKFFSSVEILAK